MLLSNLVETSRRIAGTSKRLEKIGLLADLLSQATTEEIETVVAFLSGTTRQGRIGIGYATLRDSRAEPAVNPSLTIFDIERALDDVAGIKGAGSERRKRDLLAGIYARATAPEQDFLTGLLSGELRQGALEGIMAEGLARAFRASAASVRRAIMLTGDMCRVARSLREGGEAGLAEHSIQIFRPVQAMLADSAEDASAAIAELGEAALEYKFDGARVQVHRHGDEVRVFSRRLNDVTVAVPEVVESVLAMPSRELILDGEVLSFDAQGRPHPFQTTMRRFGRRLDVESMRRELPLTPVWFDVLRADGGDVIDEPQSSRFETLRRIVPEGELTPYLVTSDPGKAEEFLQSALDRGHEGIMAKARTAGYAAGARGQSWLKVKKARTLDLVILAAEWGNGRRQGWLSNLHLGARDTEKGGYAMLGKTFKGLTDEMLAWQTTEFLKHEIARDKYTVYLEPKIVAEIAFNEIQISPTYASGLALRFARVKRYRPDKRAEDSDTFQTVKALAGVL